MRRGLNTSSLIENTSTSRQWPWKLTSHAYPSPHSLHLSKRDSFLTQVLSARDRKLYAICVNPSLWKPFFSQRVTLTLPAVCLTKIIGSPFDPISSLPNLPKAYYIYMYGSNHQSRPPKSAVFLHCLYCSQAMFSDLVGVVYGKAR